VNGQLVGSASLSGSMRLTSSINVHVGATSGFGRYFQGEMDEVRIWNSARTQAQIQAGMSPSNVSGSSGSICYLNMNHGVANATNTGQTLAGDLTGRSLNGTLYNFALSGNTSNWVTHTANLANNTVTNNALAFDGTDDYVVMSGANVNNKFASNRITLEGWFYPKASTAGLPMLVGNEGYTLVTFAVWQTGSSLKTGIFNGSAWVETSPIAITLNQWQHFACTYDQQSIKLYINGVLRATAAYTAALPVNTTNWFIGKRWDLAEHFNGNLDEIRIWNVARSQTEIQANMYGTLPAGTSNLVVYYPFNQGTNGATNTSVTSATDVGSFNIAGTLTNFGLTGTNSNWVTSTSPMYDNSPIISNIQAGQATFTSTSAYVQTGSILEQGFIYNTGNTIPTFATSSRVISSSTALGAFSAAPTGLLENQLYSVRGYITTASGTMLSNNTTTFTTTLCRIVATDVSIMATPTTASATWTTNTTGATAYSWKVVNSGAGVNGTAVSSGTSSSATANITNLVPGKNYEFYVLVTGGCTTNTWSSARTFSTQLEWNNALNFDGVDDYVSLANTTSAWNTITTNLTLEAWVRTTSNSLEQIIVHKEDNTAGYAIFISALGIPYASVATNTGWANAIGTSVVPINQWTHIAGVYNGSQIFLYVNGALITTVNKTGSISNLTNNTRIGSDMNGARLFSGALDEVRIWNVARTQSQIQAAMYNAIPTNSTGLLAYYPFDQGIANATNTSFTAATDIKSGLTGTLANFALTGNASNWIARTPYLISPTKTNIGATSATLGATVNQAGTATLTERGIIWASSAANVFFNGTGFTKVVASGASTGAFTVNATGLPLAAKVYYKGYAMSNDGYSYSALDSFLTECPVAAAPTVSNITSTTAT
jgi:hypothetical protein